MGLLSNISGKKAVKIFQKFGCTVDHQTGSHIILYHPSKPTLSIPDHKELAPGLLRALIRKSGLTVKMFLKAKSGVKKQKWFIITRLQSYKIERFMNI